MYKYGVSFKRSKLVADADNIARLLDVWQSRVPEKGHVSGFDTVHSYFLSQVVDNIAAHASKIVHSLSGPEADVGTWSDCTRGAGFPAVGKAQTRVC